MIPVGCGARRQAALLGCVVGLVTAACSPGDAGSSWQVAVDSTGAFPVVVNTPPSDVIAPTWELVETLRLGAVEGEAAHVFGDIRSVAVLADGRVAVLDYQAQEVRLFDRDGRWLRTLGGQGEGPGELSDANGMLATADGHLLVHDPRLDRRTLFHPDSGLVSTYTVPVRSYGYSWEAVEDADGVVWDRNVALLPDRGGYLDMLQGYAHDGSRRDSVEMGRRPPIDPTVRTETPSSYQWESPDGRMRGYISVPFWPRGFARMDGSHHTWTKPADVNDYRILRTMWTGDTVMVVASRRRPAPVSDAERDSAIAIIRERVEQDLDWSRIPTERAVVEGIFASEDDRLWVQVGTASGGTTFDIFGRDGVYEGTAVTSLPLRTWSAPILRGDTLWGVITDSLDVPYVVRAELRPAPAGGP